MSHHSLLLSTIHVSNYCICHFFPLWKQNKTHIMPGLINKENRSALPLSDSDITSCVRGYSLALTASMTYENIEDHDIEGECVVTTI